MHDVRREVHEDLLEAGGRQAEHKGPVAGQRDTGDADDAVAGVLLRRVVTGRDDERLVAAAGEVLEDAADRVGDTVDRGQKRFRDNCDAHTDTMSTACVVSVPKGDLGGELMMKKSSGLLLCCCPCCFCGR